MDDKAQTSHLEEGQIPKLGALGAMDLASELEALDKDMESKIRWKYDMRVVPIMSLIYLMAFIDRYATTQHSVAWPIWKLTFFCLQE